MADDGQGAKEPKQEPKREQGSQESTKQGQEPGKDPERYLEELRKQAGQDGKDGDGTDGGDEHARLIEVMKEQELTKARLEAVSQAYVDLLKQSGPGRHEDAPDFNDIIKQSRKAGGTYYGGKE